MRYPAWSPCLSDPDEFDCGECEIGYVSRCPLRSDDALRQERAAQWRRRAGLPSAIGDDAREMLENAAAQIVRQGIPVPSIILFEGLPENLRVTGGPDELAALMRLSDDFSERADGLFTSSTSDPDDLGPPIGVHDTATGAQIESLLHDNAPLPPLEQARLLARLGGLRVARAAGRTAGEAAGTLELIMRRDLSELRGRYRWSLADVQRYSRGQERLPVVQEGEAELGEVRSRALSAVFAFDLIHEIGMDLL